MNWAGFFLKYEPGYHLRISQKFEGDEEMWAIHKKTHNDHFFLSTKGQLSAFNYMSNFLGKRTEVYTYSYAKAENVFDILF